MAEFLTTNGTSYQIENIIIDSSSKLTLISPFLQISKTFLERLKDASNRDVAIKIIYGKDELKESEKKSLTELKNLELYFFRNLHAKCYYNEKRMVITSMNMYEFSEKNNREMGVLIDRVNDSELYTKAVNETESILQSSEKIFLEQPKKMIFVSEVVKQKPFESIKLKQHTAFCLRCGKNISYSPNAPYCDVCYKSWAHFQNWNFPEKYCHKCGTGEVTSMSSPQCHSCHKSWVDEKKVTKM